MAVNFLFLIVLLLIHHLPLRTLGHNTNFQSLNSLLSLQGLSKGHTAKDIPNLKHYLKRFGYLNNYDETTLNNNNNQKDYFDDALESAVKLYQKNYNLNVTGKLDSATIKQMSLPRCGVPDNVQYVIPGAKWPPNKYHLTYAFNSSKQPALPPEDVRTTVAFAFTLWARNSVFTFQEVDLGQPHDLVLGFHQGYHGDNGPFDGPYGVLAHATPPTEGILHYDVEEYFSISDPAGAGKIDFLWVSMHEIGHLLGMGHSLDPLAVMYATVTPGMSRKNLNADDVAGIHTLYLTP